jgi:hypothetical protein
VLRSRDLGRATSVRRWTSTAVECYKRVVFVMVVFIAASLAEVRKDAR